MVYRELKPSQLYGVLFIINNSIGLVTPPVGTVLNVVAGLDAYAWMT